MNFLAHIYLSGEDPEIKLGNFMADAVKGNQVNQYNQKIQIGIKLHRAIDAYTDAHPTFRQSTRRLMENNLVIMPESSSTCSTIISWRQIGSNTTMKIYPHLPSDFNPSRRQKHTYSERTQHLIPYMIEQNWLVKYQTLEGLDQIMRQMNKRTKGSNMDQAGLELRQNYPEFLKEFQSFFKELITFSREERERLIHNFKAL